MRSGDPLDYRDNMLYIHGTGKAVAKLSFVMQKKLEDWQQRGYQVLSASVRFVVAWKGKEAPKEEKETAVLLPDMVMGKENDDMC